jgi:hypothetical protein
MEADGTDITEIELGDTYRDTITGFEGKVVGRADYLTGCAQALLTALVNGEVNSVWFDYPRLEFVSDAERPALAGEPAVRRSGGPTPLAGQAAPRPQ